MIIDLNIEGSLTPASVAKLSASKDDSQPRQIRVSKDGKVFLSDEIGNVNTEDLAFALETTLAGMGYSGVEASRDPQWVNKVYSLIADAWFSQA